MWFTRKIEGKPLIKNRPGPSRRKDFSLSAPGLGILALLVAFALSARLLSGARPALVEFGALLAAPIAATLLMTLFPRWSDAVKMLLLGGLAIGAWAAPGSGLVLAFAAAGLFLAPSVQRVEEWERAIVLRFGRFHRVRGPGLYLLLPLADRAVSIVDLRIRVTDFAAETTLTRDSVTVTVDALCFWLVWDAEKAICEVQNYEEAVVLSSKTALRNAVSRNLLSDFLENGDAIERQIREEVDRKTTEWGITVQHIEITDIQIPEKLQDSMSRLAQAEREKKSRILLAEAEIEIARRLEEAARIYGSNEVIMKLKSLSILNEGLKAGNSMMLVPNSVAEELGTGGELALQALNEARKNKENEHERG